MANSLERKIDNSITQFYSGMRASYEAGRPSRFVERPQGVITTGSGADYHTGDLDYYYMIEMARNYERNDPIFSQGVQRFVDNVVQGGFTYRPQTGVDRIDRMLTEDWLAYADDENAESVDEERERSWHDFEHLAARRMIIDGDLGINPVRGGRLQALEAHRIRHHQKSLNAGNGNAVILGVELNRRRQRRRYYITKHEYDGRHLTGSTFDYQSINAWSWDDLLGRYEKNFFHVYDPKRFSQTRGVTAIAPVANTIGMHGDVQFAQLVKQQMASYIGFFHKIPESMSETYEPPAATLDYTYGDSRKTRAADLSPGAEYYPDYAGEEIQAFQANIPGDSFFDHSKLLLTFVAVNLGMPLIVFMLDASETNFSSWRGALDQAKIRWKQFQRVLSGRLHSPVQRMRIRRNLRFRQDYFDAWREIGDDIFRMEWVPPRWPYIQPKEDAEADILEKQGLLSSPRRICDRRSERYDLIVEESVTDNATLIARCMDAAVEINKHPFISEHPNERVSWRDLDPRMIPATQRQIQDDTIEGGDGEGEKPKPKPGEDKNA